MKDNFFVTINIFIQQGHIKWIQIYIKDIFWTIITSKHLNKHTKVISCGLFT